jgi:hypothetical protein
MIGFALIITFLFKDVSNYTHLFLRGRPFALGFSKENPEFQFSGPFLW